MDNKNVGGSNPFGSGRPKLIRPGVSIQRENTPSLDSASVGTNLQKGKESNVAVLQKPRESVVVGGIPKASGTTSSSPSSIERPQILSATMSEGLSSLVSYSSSSSDASGSEDNWQDDSSKAKDNLGNLGNLSAENLGNLSAENLTMKMQKIVGAEEAQGTGSEIPSLSKDECDKAKALNVEVSKLIRGNILPAHTIIKGGNENVTVVREVKTVQQLPEKNIAVKEAIIVRQPAEKMTVIKQAKIVQQPAEKINVIKETKAVQQPLAMIDAVKEVKAPQQSVGKVNVVKEVKVVQQPHPAGKINVIRETKSVQQLAEKVTVAVKPKSAPQPVSEVIQTIPPGQSEVKSDVKCPPKETEVSLSVSRVMQPKESQVLVGELLLKRVEDLAKSNVQQDSKKLEIPVPSPDKGFLSGEQKSPLLAEGTQVSQTKTYEAPRRPSTEIRPAGSNLDERSGTFHKEKPSQIFQLPLEGEKRAEQLPMEIPSIFASSRPKEEYKTDLPKDIMSESSELSGSTDSSQTSTQSSVTEDASRMSSLMEAEEKEEMKLTLPEEQNIPLDPLEAQLKLLTEGHPESSLDPCDAEGNKHLKCFVLVDYFLIGID